jgi:hypothetical protein
MKTIITEKPDSKLCRKWESLWAESDNANVYNSPGWFKACSDVFGKNIIAALYDNGNLKSVLALTATTHLGIKTWSNAGAGFCDKCSLLADEFKGGIIEQIADAVSGTGNIVLTGIDQNLTVNFESDLYPANPYFVLTTGDDPLHNLDKKQRKKIESKIKNNLKDLKYIRIRENLSDSFDIILKLEENSRKHGKGITFFSKLHSIEFIKAVIRHMGEFTVLDVLYFKDEPLVYSLGFRYKNKLDVYQTSFNETYKNLNPGRLILYYILTTDSELEHLDLSAGYSQLKKDFADAMYVNANFYYSQFSAVGRYWKTAHDYYYRLKNNPRVVSGVNTVRNYFT